MITPAFNSLRFIESCIREVIDQGCSVVEHIIVDGGSSDGSVEIIRKAAEENSHIRWISESDAGQSDAMNKGLAMARGEIVNFLNVDDGYEPDVHRRVLHHFETLPEPALLVGNCNLWAEGGRLIMVNRPRRLKLIQLLMGPRINPFPFNPSAYFYHKSLHERAGPYDVDEHYAMDLDFLLEAVQFAHVRYVDEIWGNFHLLEGSKTRESEKTGTKDDTVARVMARFQARLSRRDKLKLRLLKPIYRTLRLR